MLYPLDQRSRTSAPSHPASMNVLTVSSSAMGKSRSATLVVAYMLSQDSSLTPSAALASLRTVRPIAEPNPGFMQQLWMYHAMGCPADVESQPSYQRWLYQRQVDLSIACGQAPETIRFEDEAAPLSADVGSLEIRCRRCRRTLASDQYIVDHRSKQHPAAAGPIEASEPIDTLPIAAPGQTAPLQSAANSMCAHIFLDPLSWMRAELEQGKLEGRLECPNEKCHAAVGRYAWQGMKCSCGRWVVPALSLARGRVDEVRRRAGMAPRPAANGLGNLRTVRDGKM